MTWREGLGQVNAKISRKSNNPKVRSKIGKVFGIVTTENTPTKEAFERAGGFSGIGAILYLDYDLAKNITGSVDSKFIESCKLAYPKDPQSQYYPLYGELVFIYPGPGRSNANTAATNFYTHINVWNNAQDNSKLISKDESLGATFISNKDIRPLITYEGDNILLSRQGSSLRFSTTTKGVEPSNQWSSVGGDFDPITILSNGLKFDPSKKFYVEQINEDLSSIYLTSTQVIPLKTDKTGILNNRTVPILVSNYNNSQIILNSDRITLNSKKDEVMIFAKTNIELNTKNIINLNADEQVHLNSNKVYLGTDLYNHQPVLLGNNTIKLLQELQKTLTTLGEKLKKATAVKEGSPMPTLNTAGTELLKDMKRMAQGLNNITSKNVFTI
jgi:hypothetical protein